MKLEDLTLADMKAADAAATRFGERATTMEYTIQPNGVTTFSKSGEYFQWYWFDPSRDTWRDHHMLQFVKDDNWLLHEAI